MGLPWDSSLNLLAGIALLLFAMITMRRGLDSEARRWFFLYVVGLALWAIFQAVKSMYDDNTLEMARFGARMVLLPFAFALGSLFMFSASFRFELQSVRRILLFLPTVVVMALTFVLDMPMWHLEGRGWFFSVISPSLLSVVYVAYMSLMLFGSMFFLGGVYKKLGDRDLRHRMSLLMAGILLTVVFAVLFSVLQVLFSLPFLSPMAGFVGLYPMMCSMRHLDEVEMGG